MLFDEDARIASDPSNLGGTTVLLTGATGYVGGCLLRRLETQARHRVRCLTRRPESLAGRIAEEQRSGVLAMFSTRRHSLALRGVHTAYYLVHSMNASGDFEALDRVAASNFAAAAKRAGVRRIVYLGGLGEGRGLSSHLASRQEVGEIFRSSGIPTIEFRASIVIGSGSASYEIVRALVESLPVIVTPRWWRPPPSRSRLRTSSSISSRRSITTARGLRDRRGRPHRLRRDPP